MGRGIFIISRSLGLTVHALEEIKQGKPYKKISEEDIEYIGPEEKEMPIRINHVKIFFSWLIIYEIYKKIPRALYGNWWLPPWWSWGKDSCKCIK